MNDDLAYCQIERLQRRYADVSTRGAYDARVYAEVADLLTPDAPIVFSTAGGEFEVVGPAGFAKFSEKATAGKFSFFQYTMLNFVVDIGDGVATGRTYAHEITEERESGAWGEFYGAYDDEYQFYEGTWRFARRHYHAIGVRDPQAFHAFPLPGSYLPGG